MLNKPSTEFAILYERAQPPLVPASSGLLHLRNAHSADIGFNLAPVKERQVLALQHTLRSKPQWWRKVADPAVVARWRDEAAAQGIDGPFFDVAIDELQWHAAAAERVAVAAGGVPGLAPAPVAGAWLADSLVPEAVRQGLVARLEARRADVGTDYHPGSGRKVQNYVHPSLHACYRGVTRVKCEATGGAADATAAAYSGEADFNADFNDDDNEPSPLPPPPPAPVPAPAPGPPARRRPPFAVAVNAPRIGIVIDGAGIHDPCPVAPETPPLRKKKAPPPPAAGGGKHVNPRAVDAVYAEEHYPPFKAHRYARPVEDPLTGLADPLDIRRPRREALELQEQIDEQRNERSAPSCVKVRTRAPTKAGAVSAAADTNAGAPPPGPARAATALVLPEIPIADFAVAAFDERALVPVARNTEKHHASVRFSHAGAVQEPLPSGFDWVPTEVDVCPATGRCRFASAVPGLDTTRNACDAGVAAGLERVLTAGLPAVECVLRDLLAGIAADTNDVRAMLRSQLGETAAREAAEDDADAAAPRQAAPVPVEADALSARDAAAAKSAYTVHMSRRVQVHDTRLIRQCDGAASGVVTVVANERFVPHNRGLEHALGAMLRGRRLQVIPKASRIYLEPGQSYDGGEWHVEGSVNERIVATLIYYAEQVNVTESRLSFCAPVKEGSVVNVYSTSHDQEGGKTAQACELIEEVYGIDTVQTLAFSPENRGSVATDVQGRLLAFPNTLPHRLGGFGLRDATKPGWRTTIVFFVVDPERPVLSTAHIPAQDAATQHTVLAQLLRGPLRGNMDVVDIVAEFLVRGITRTQQLRRRKALMEDRSRLTDRRLEADAIKMQLTNFQMCEH